tara:strand:+ start:1188 stop:2321 length:1134 start_codon:yes stop_codon:yes gene_type:complete
MHIPFNKPIMTGNELKYIEEAYSEGKFSGDGKFTDRCHLWLEKNLGVKKVLLTHSCTAALEMCALLLDIQEGDEIIMPSYTFVSTANAFVLRGATPIFADIDKNTLCLSEVEIEKAISNKTKAIVAVDYAGVSSNYDKIKSIADHKNIKIIADSAQGILSKFKNNYLGTLGNLGCLSFHETKNITCGEGGAILINDEELIDKAVYIREKGTNRSKFILGQVDKYTWIEKGSSFLPGEVNAAFLLAQLEQAKMLTDKRLNVWKKYMNFFSKYEDSGVLRRPFIPEYNQHNAHMFYLLFNSEIQRNKFISDCKNYDVHCVFHYIPLHSSPAGQKYGKVSGSMENTDYISSSLVRLPLWVGIDNNLNYLFEVFEKVLGDL